MRMRAPLALLLAMVATLSAGCGKRDQDEALRMLRAALARTERVSYRYLYTERTAERTDTVRGIVEDDFRYKAELAVGGRPVYDEVVSDDALAARVLDTEILQRLGRPGSAPPPGAGSLAPGATADVLAATDEALRANRWVLDDDGAPNLLPAGDQARKPGEDPVVDSLTVLRYVESVTREMRVGRFNRDALDYRPKEDPFADPERLFPGQDVQRYDFVQNPLPRASDAAIAGNQRLPSVTNFRKLAVYVNKDGLVVRVDETIDVVNRLKDLRRNYSLDLPSDPEEAARVAINAINAVRRGQGEDPIRVRTMTLALFDLGRPNRVTLPTDTTPGDLSLLRDRGRVTVTGVGASPATTAPAG